MKVRTRVKLNTAQHMQERELNRRRPTNLLLEDAISALNDVVAGRVWTEAELRNRRSSREHLAAMPNVGTGYDFIRSGGQSGVRIRYHRASVHRATKRLNGKGQAIIARLAHIVCMQGPEAAQAVLALPAWRVGHIVKAVLRRKQRGAEKRGRFRRRRKGYIFRT
ncbi:hypothetical protein BH160DRAFT_1178 [Burkholderia sp. H160]|nr:hypothetical protein BH160DRAFT_1178 [Burkholderia sp. H160]